MNGKTVFITGAASGIGAATARRYADAGARLALLDRNEDALRALAREFESHGVEALALPADVTDADACRNAVQQAATRFGGIDVLINNAGITHISRFADTDPDVLCRVMDVNFFGAVHCTHAAVPHLAKSRGRIAVISSIAGFAPLLGRTGYCASKYALHGLFETLRAELRTKGVSVTIVCPIFTESNLESTMLDGGGRLAGRKRSEIGQRAPAAYVADRIYRATTARKRLVVLSARGTLAWWISRICPPLYERLMTRQFRQELDGGD